MIREASSIGVVLGDPQIGLVIEQPVQYMRRISDRGGNDLGVKGGVLIGNMSVEGYFALTWPDASPRPPARNRWPSEEEVAPSPQCAANGNR
jgi:hypothetical protein